MVALQYPSLQLFDPVRLRELALVVGRHVGTFRSSRREHLGISISATANPVDGSIKKKKKDNHLAIQASREVISIVIWQPFHVHSTPIGAVDSRVGHQGQICSIKYEEIRLGDIACKRCDGHAINNGVICKAKWIPNISQLAWLKRRISSLEVVLANLSAIFLLIEFFLSKNQGILLPGSGSSVRRIQTRLLLRSSLPSFTVYSQFIIVINFKYYYSLIINLNTNKMGECEWSQVKS